MAMLFPCLAWLLVSLVGFYLFTHDRRRGLPPGPRPLPVIGSLHLLGDQPHRSLARLAKIHGPLMSLRLGTVTTVVASSPAVARELLQRNDAVISNRSVPAATGDHAENSIVWLPNAPRWRALRKTMAVELFARHRLDALQHLRREKVQELVDHVGRLALRGQAVNVSRAAFTTSMNLLSGTFFSRNLASLDDDDGRSREFQQVVTDMLEELGGPNISDFFPASRDDRGRVSVDGPVDDADLVLESDVEAAPEALDAGVSGRAEVEARKRTRSASVGRSANTESSRSAGSEDHPVPVPPRPPHAMGRDLGTRRRRR